MIKEVGQVFVGLLNLVPKAGDSPVLQIGTDQGGLAAAPRTGDPDDRAVLKAVQSIKQTLPGNSFPENWATVFGRRGIGIKLQIQFNKEMIP